MKKILALVLATTMVFSIIACGNKDVAETTESNVVSTETATTETVTTESVTTESASTEGATGTIGEAALEAFKAFAEANPDATAEEVANAIVPALEDYFGPVVMPVEEGLLNGFDNAEIKGFEEGVIFAPMIGTIPFVGYVFTLAEDADAEAFMEGLEAAANPRWNICTEADEMFAEVVGNKVFFVMSPSSFE